MSLDSVCAISACPSEDVTNGTSGPLVSVPMKQMEFCLVTYCYIIVILYRKHNLRLPLY